MSIRFLLVDGFNLIRRVFEARHARSEQDLEEVVSATRLSLQRAVESYRPTHAAVVLEGHDRTWRHLLYPEYKGERSPTPVLLLENLDKFEAAFASLGVNSLSVESYEADDVIATIARVVADIVVADSVADNESQAVILSTDKIFLQLLSTRIRVVDHFTDREYYPADVEERYKVTVAQYIDYLALVGDKSNNIKGVPGIGKKTAADLMQRYGSLDGILQGTIAGSDDDKHRQKVLLHQKLASRCQQLITLKTNVQLGQNLKYFRITLVNKELVNKQLVNKQPVNK